MKPQLRYVSRLWDGLASVSAPPLRLRFVTHQTPALKHSLTLYVSVANHTVGVSAVELVRPNWMGFIHWKSHPNREENMKPSSRLGRFLISGSLGQPT